MSDPTSESLEALQKDAEKLLAKTTNPEIQDGLKELISVTSGAGYYEVEFPDGSMKKMSWKELHHDVTGLKATDPAMHAKVKYRWVRGQSFDR